MIDNQVELGIITKKKKKVELGIFYLLRIHDTGQSLSLLVLLSTSTYIWKVKRNIFSILIKYELSVKTKKWNQEYVLLNLV